MTKRIAIIGGLGENQTSLVKAVLNAGAYIVIKDNTTPVLDLPKAKDIFIDAPPEIIEDSGQCRYCNRFHHNSLTKHEQHCRKRK